MKRSSATSLVSAAALLAVCLGSTYADAAHRVILPENRTAYYASEPIEIAITHLSAATGVPRVELVPTTSLVSPVSFPATGTGTQTFVLPALSLAPSVYNVRIDGADTATKITVSSGVNVSTMLLSSSNLVPPVGNFAVGNTSLSGLLDAGGMPAKDPLGLKSETDSYFDGNIANNTPTLVYQYLTSSVNHRPWGINKSWAASEEFSIMRMFNYHAAQQLRKYASNIIGIGTIDEPSLSLGRTAAGGTASGFPNWDETDWYSSRGAEFTDNPGALSDPDWLKFISVRTQIIKQNEAWAKQDIKTVWPRANFATDLAEPQEIMDGADPMNQEVNDIPTARVVTDYGLGKLGVIGAVYLEKCHQPTAKVADASSGQVFGSPDPLPNQIAAYRLMLNGMLAAGLSSNWWLNTGPLKPADLAAIHAPVLQYGPLFKCFTLDGHDVAILWSSTELAMREKDLTAREANKKEGDPLDIPMTTWPENQNFTTGEVAVNAYDIGSNYREVVLDTHQALSRAGYAAQIVHERLLPRGVLKNYKALVITGQTYPLPADVMKAISDFAQSGGQVIVDPATTVTFPGAIVSTAKLKDPYWRWSVPFLKATNDPTSFASSKERSYYLTNAFMDLTSRGAAVPMLAAVQKTAAVPVFDSQSVDLAGERHVAGEGQLLMILNGNDPLPKIADTASSSLYNYAPCTATYTLHGIKLGSVVYEIQGTDWDNVSQLNTWPDAQTSSFDAGEMKLFLVAPRAPTGLGLSAVADRLSITVSGVLGGVKMPWPLEVAVIDPHGKILYDVYRAMDAAGKYAETYALGANCQAGVYNITLKSPVGGFAERVSVDVGMEATSAAQVPVATAIAGSVRVFDEPSIRTYLSSRPPFTIVVGNPAYEPAALKLEGALALRGIKAAVSPEAQVFTRARYPRVWDPYVTVYEPLTPDTIAPLEPADAAVRITLTTAPESMRTIALGQNGTDLGENWRKPLTLATVGSGGYIDFDYEHFYEAGVDLYVDKSGALTVVRGTVTQAKTTYDVQQKWSRPWDKLMQHAGTDALMPELPEAYSADANLILLGNSGDGALNAALQASELLPEVADADYPGPGKALIGMAWSPFSLGHNVIILASSDDAGLQAAIDTMTALAK